MVQIPHPGSDVDKWTISELETMVELFKRSMDGPKNASKFKVQEVELYVRDW
jgi:hypothetical protein